MVSVLNNSYDYLYLHNGLSDGNQSIGELTGHIATGSSFASTGNALYVRFTSDTSLKQAGFNIQYQSGNKKSVHMFKLHLNNEKTLISRHNMAINPHFDW